MIWMTSVFSLQAGHWIVTTLAIRANTEGDARYKAYSWYNALPENTKEHFNYFGKGLRICACGFLEIIE